MSTGRIIKKIREDKGLMQKEVSAHLEIGNSNYNKLENGHRDLSVDELLKLSKLFNLTTDQILNYENIIPEDVTIEDKPDFEKLHLINQLDEDDKSMIFKMVDKMLTTKKFKDFFNNNFLLKKITVQNMIPQTKPLNNNIRKNNLLLIPSSGLIGKLIKNLNTE
jgi:transcriptional regulator with XRE-family HTH domain